MRSILILLALVLFLSYVSNVTTKFVNETEVQFQKSRSGRMTRTATRVAAYYFGTSLALNVAFRDEKRLAGIEAAKQLFTSMNPSIRPFVISYSIAIQKRRFFPGYYIITNVPTLKGSPGSLNKSHFPYAQELFEGMCRPLTAWQSFTVGQTIQPWFLGTENFCQGQLLWHVGPRSRPVPMALDDHDRTAIFHSWIWWKQIVKAKKYTPIMKKVTTILFKTWVVAKNPRFLPFLLLPANAWTTLSDGVKSILKKKGNNFEYINQDAI